MKRNSDEWRNKWGKSREKGKYRYILYNSFLFTIFGNLASALFYILVEGSILNETIMYEFLSWRIILRLLYYFSAAIVYLFIAWRRNERTFKSNPA